MGTGAERRTGGPLDVTDLVYASWLESLHDAGRRLTRAQRSELTRIRAEANLPPYGALSELSSDDVEWQQLVFGDDW